MSDLNMSDGKMSDFVSFPLLGFTVAIKLRNFDFVKHWNTLIIFDKKRYGVRFENDPWKNVWFCFISIVIVISGFHKWLLSQNQRTGNDFFAYRRYKALAKHIKLFFRKH